MDPTIVVAAITVIGSMVTAFFSTRTALRAEKAKRTAEDNTTKVDANRLQMEQWQAIIAGHVATIEQLRAEVTRQREERTADRAIFMLELAEEKAITESALRRADLVKDDPPEEPDDGPDAELGSGDPNED